VTTLHLVPADIQQRYEVREWRNAAAVLKEANPAEWADILEVLRGFSLLASDIITPGGSKSDIAGKLDGPLTSRGWIEHMFTTKITVDAVVYDSPTHKVDCFKGRVALEVEWNNKDPFYDRDLNNFRMLYDLRVIDLGVIVTRCSELQAIFKALGRGKSFGNSTTHMAKLLPRLEGGSGGGCPVLTFGIAQTCYVDDIAATPGLVAVPPTSGDVAGAADASALIDDDILIENDASNNGEP
jgi:hypothetical protein